MFFLFIGLLFGSSQEVSIEFYNTVIEMPLGSNPYDYVEIPYAVVMKDDQPIEDARIIYERGVERTFLSVLHTKEVKSFYIKYRAHAPDYHVHQTVTITFKVYDDIPPVITLNYDLIFEVRENVQFLDAFKFNDNYDDVQSLYIYIVASEVNLDRVGLYPLVVVVKDTSLNETKQTFYVEVLDFEPPEISLIKDIVIEIHTPIHIHHFIKTKDNHDQNLNIELNTDAVDFETLGTYVITLCVLDQSLNETCLNTTLTFVDTTPPELVLISYMPVLEVHTPPYLMDLYAYVVEVSDNYDTLLLSDVLIQSDLRIDTLGQYNITYIIKDQSNNITTKSINVMVKDTQPPLVMTSKPLIFEVFKAMDPLEMYFYIEDLHDDVIHLDIKYEHQLNLEKLGTYTIEVIVKDRSKNQAIYLFFAKVVDLTPPEIESLDAIIVSDFKQPNYIERIKIYDNYATFQTLDIIIEDDHIDYENIGMYKIQVIVIDPSENIIKKDIDVMIVDIIPPEITLKTYSIIIDTNVQALDLRSYIENVDDNVTPIVKEDVIITHDIEFGKVGKYHIYYHVADSSLTSTKVLLEIYIDVLYEPTVRVNHLNYMIGDPINLQDALEISSLNVQEIQVYYDEQLHQTPGMYEVMFIIYDLSGNHQIFTSFVTIEKPKLQHTLQQYLPIISTMIFGLIISFILKKYFSVDRFDKHQQFIYNDSSEHKEEN